MSKKNKKTKSKKNNKKRLAIILSSILGTGILATAITLPIVLTRKGGKDGGGNVGPLDYLDHFEKEISDATALANFDPQLHIFKDLTLDYSSVEQDKAKDITKDLISNITSNYDEETAKEKIEEFIKYIVFINNVLYGDYQLYIALSSDMKFSGNVEYTLNDFKYQFNENSFNFSFSTIAMFRYKAEADWGEITGKAPDGYNTEIYVEDTITNKSQDDITFEKGVSYNGLLSKGDRDAIQFECKNFKDSTSTDDLNSAWNSQVVTNTKTGETHEAQSEKYQFLYLQKIMSTFYFDWKSFGPFGDINFVTK